MEYVYGLAKLKTLHYMSIFQGSNLSIKAVEFRQYPILEGADARLEDEPPRHCDNPHMTSSLKRRHSSA
jgi:hypothetical protein